MKWEYNLKILILNLFILLAASLTGCGTATTIYADSKKEVCQDTCNLKHSRYDHSNLNQCLMECERNLVEDVANSPVGSTKPASTSLQVPVTK